MAARLVGAGPIIGVDIIPKRLKLALELGATHVIDSRRQDVAARIAEITGGGVNYVIESSGDQKMHQLAIDVLNSCVVVALLTGETGIKSLSRGRKTLGTIQGDAVPQSFIPRRIELYRAGPVSI